MNTKTKERVYGMYTPQFSDMASIAVRRLAWALNVNMVKTVDAIILLLPRLLDKSKVCTACKDNTKCKNCVFNIGDVPPVALVDMLN